jgi:hypothetical protein
MESKQNLLRRPAVCPRIAATLFLLCIAASAQAQIDRPTDAQLAEITARGRALAAYDFAAWHGTDAIAALKPPEGVITEYVARDTPKAWVVVFGRLTAGRDTFLVAYEAIRTSMSGAFEGFVSVPHQTPVADTGYYVHATLAMDTAKVLFGPVRRSYNVAALPAPNGNWWVYLVPAPTITGVWPLGADERFLISGDGRKVLERRRLHNSVIEWSPARLQKPPGTAIQASVHTAVLADIPEDTDVYHVITRTPKVAEYVMTDHFAYKIDPDGKIVFPGTH